MYLKFLQFISYFAIVKSSSIAPSTLVINRIGPCYDDPQDAIIKTSEFKIVLDTETYGTEISCEFNISENVENGWNVKSTMQKCVDIRNKDTCDFFKTFVAIKNGCNEEGNLLFYIDMIMAFIIPSLECPLRAGQYKIVSLPYFGKSHREAMVGSSISTSVFGFLMRHEGTTVDHRKLFCLESYLQLSYKRKHQWTNKEPSVTTTSPAEGRETEN